jgi:tRNA (guanine37-N1)-methyltransferase
MPLIGFRSFRVHALKNTLHFSGPLCYSDARSMHRKVTIDTSPPPARWMKDTLVRSAFHRTVPVVAARLPAAKTGFVLKSEAMRG